MNSLEWQAETQRLDEVKGVIRRQIDSMQDTVEHRKSEMRELREEFWDDTTLNTANKDDLMEMKASITQQSRLIQEQERSYSRAELAIRHCGGCCLPLTSDGWILRKRAQANHIPFTLVWLR